MNPIFGSRHARRLRALLAALLPTTSWGQNFTKVFPMSECNFDDIGKNPFFPLTPGREAHYSNKDCVAAGDCEDLETVVITVLNETRNLSVRLAGKFRPVRTRVIREVERANGEIIEISRNFFAQCKATRDVYYFGEDVDIFEEDGTVVHNGAWLAGRNDARADLIMPGGAILLGSRYFQELAPGVALDRAELVDERLEVETDAGTFRGCIEVEETAPLEPGATSKKVYCPGVGLVIDNEIELIKINTVK